MILQLFITVDRTDTLRGQAWSTEQMILQTGYTSGGALLNSSYPLSIAVLTVESRAMSKNKRSFRRSLDLKSSGRSSWRASSKPYITKPNEYRKARLEYKGKQKKVISSIKISQTSRRASTFLSSTCSRTNWSSSCLRRCTKYATSFIICHKNVTS